MILLILAILAVGLPIYALLTHFGIIAIIASTPIFKLALSLPLLFGTADQATKLIPQEDPPDKWTFSAGQKKTIEFTVAQNIKTLMVWLKAQVDTAATAPGRSADSPYDAIQSIRVKANGTDITYEPHIIRALAEMHEQQSVSLEDKPSVATSQTDDDFGFRVFLPCPIVADGDNPQNVAIAVEMATDADLDASSGSNYSNFDGDLYLALIPADPSETIVPMTDAKDNQTGTADLRLKIRKGTFVYMLVLTNEVQTPSAPSAGNDEVKYENSFTNINWFLGTNRGKQFDDVPDFKQLVALSGAQNNVAERDGFFTLRPKRKIQISSNNSIDMEADTTATRSKLFALVDPDKTERKGG